MGGSLQCVSGCGRTSSVSSSGLRLGVVLFRPALCVVAFVFRSAHTLSAVKFWRGTVGDAQSSVFELRAFMQDASHREELPRLLLLFDGECAVCDSTVQWLLARDPAGVLAYAPLQGETAAAVRSRHPEWPANMDSLVLVRQTPQGEALQYYSSAVLSAVAELPGLVPALARAVLWVPRVLRDPFYRAFARIRYRVFGKVETCRIPSASQEARFYA